MFPNHTYLLLIKILLIQKLQTKEKILKYYDRTKLLFHQKNRTSQDCSYETDSSTETRWSRWFFKAHIIRDLSFLSTLTHNKEVQTQK